jgi:hypothetical protein
MGLQAAHTVSLALYRGLVSADLSQLGSDGPGIQRA